MLNSQLKEFYLENGLKIIIVENHRSPVAIFQIFYKVGSCDEYFGKTGISHALEHMMFRGTKHYSAEYFLQTIAGYGGQQNAYTTRDYTAYHETLRVDKLSFCFKFEADRMQNLLLDKNDFQKEALIVMEERRMTVEDDPQRLALEQFAALGFTSTSYRYPVIGWMNDISHLTVHDLRRWYKKWYVPNNAVLVIVGDVDPKKILRLADRYFAKLSPKKLPLPRVQKEIAASGVRFSTLNVQRKTPILLYGFNAPVINTAQNKWEPYALLILCELLLGSSSSRLQRKLVRDKAIALSLSYFYTPFSRMETLLTFIGIPIQGFKLDDLKIEFNFAIKQLQEVEVKLQELDRVKTNIIAHKVYGADSIVNIAHEIGSFEMTGITWHEIDAGYELIRQISAKQLQEVANKYLRIEHSIETRLEPKEE